MTRMTVTLCAAALLTASGQAMGAAAAAAATVAVSATDYPAKPVRFISPFSAGGGTDAVARTLALRLGEQMGRAFVVDNRGGAEGAVGTELAAKSPADGYTLLVANMGTLCMTPLLRKVPYDPLRDFAPVSQTTASSSVLAISPSLPARTLKEFVSLAKAKPGQLNYGSSSNATALPMEMFKQIAGFEIKGIPYKGTAPSVIAVMSGEVSAMFGGAIATVPHVRSGKLRAIAVAGNTRAQALPDVATIAESGYPGFEANSWNGIVAPAGTPRAIIDKLNTAIGNVLRTPEVRNYMIGDGAEPTPGTPEQLIALIRADHAKWAKVIKVAGLRDSQ